MIKRLLASEGLAATLFYALLAMATFLAVITIADLMSFYPEGN